MPIPPFARELEALRRRYDTAEALTWDPLSIPLSYEDPWDREVAAWVSAHLAYGRVAPMLRAIAAVLAPLGPSPAAFLRSESAQALEPQLATWKWRFHTGQDIVAWLEAWRRLDQESGAAGLQPHLTPTPDRDAESRLSSLVQRLRRDLPQTYGLRFSLPDPLEGAACKRWRMFLRWMVRTGWPDLGQWTDCPAASLVIPLDTHVARVSRYIGLTSRTTPDGRMAHEITDALRRLDPADPLKFDFALSHLGILGDCPGIRTLPACSACPLVSICSAGLKR